MPLPPPQVDELPVDAPAAPQVDALPVDALASVPQVDELPIHYTPGALTAAPAAADPYADAPQPPSSGLGVVVVGRTLQRCL